MEMDGSEGGAFFQHDPLKPVVVKETYNGNTLWDWNHRTWVDLGRKGYVWGGGSCLVWYFDVSLLARHGFKWYMHWPCLWQIWGSIAIRKWDLTQWSWEISDEEIRCCLSREVRFFNIRLNWMHILGVPRFSSFHWVVPFHGNFQHFRGMPKRRFPELGDTLRICGYISDCLKVERSLLIVFWLVFDDVWCLIRWKGLYLSFPGWCFIMFHVSFHASQNLFDLSLQKAWRHVAAIFLTWSCRSMSVGLIRSYVEPICSMVLEYLPTFARRKSPVL